MKNNSNYFSHDGNASQDPKIMELLMIHKLEGYGLYWRIIEMLFNADGYKLECSKCQAIAYQLHLSFEAFDIIYKFFINIGLLIEKDGQFWSDSLLKRMELKEEIRKKRIEAGRQGGINKSKQNVANAKQIASNKIKLNKIKLKEINKNILSKDNIIYIPKNNFDYSFVNEFLNKEHPIIKYQIQKEGLDIYLGKQYEVVDKLIKDGFTLEQIQLTLLFIKQDDFWKNNILTIKKLRQKNKDGVPYIVVILGKAKDFIEEKQNRTYQKTFLHGDGQNYVSN